MSSSPEVGAQLTLTQRFRGWLLPCLPVSRHVFSHLRLEQRGFNAAAASPASSTISTDGERSFVTMKLESEYDAETLGLVLQEAGFRKVLRQSWGEGNFPGGADRETHRPYSLFLKRSAESSAALSRA